MSVFGNFGSTLETLITSERQAEFSSIVVDKLYTRLRRDDFGIVIDGVRNGDLSASLIVDATYNAIPYVTGDACTITSCDISPEYSAKVWELVFAECRHTLCTRTATRKFMALYGQYKAIRPDDSEYDFLIEQLTDILTDIIFNSLIAKLFLSDSALTGNTINGTDGFIAQWKLDAGNLYPVTSQVTSVTAITGEEWIKILQGMKEAYESKPFRSTVGQAQFVIDEVAARKIVNFLNAAGNQNVYDCSCIDPDGITRAGRFSVEGLTIGGIPVKTIPYTDMASSFPDLLDQDDDLVQPVFAVLTPKTEVQIGTPNENELEMNESFYDRTTRLYNFDIGYQFGAMIPSNHFILATS